MPSTAPSLQPTEFIDSDHPDVRAFARSATADAATEADVVAGLFAAVRDHIRYDPYAFDLRPEYLRASAVLSGRPNWCVPKATLLAAACRAVGVPAAVGFADVRNHLSSAKLEALMGTDVFSWHGYTAVEVDGAVRKASPAFNAELCDRFGVPPLTFDGSADALMHAFDGQGRRHMEYLLDRGTYADVPVPLLVTELTALYPGMLTASDAGRDEAFS